jgi:hypothetical protein
MAVAAIRIVPDEGFDDWVVRDDEGHELGHFPTRESAERVGRALAQQRHGDLIVCLPDGTTSRKSFR